MQDGRKICPARSARGELLWVDLVETEQRWDHVCDGQNSVASYCEQWARSMFLFVLNFQLPNPHGDTVHPLAGDPLTNAVPTSKASTSKEKAYSLIVYFAMPPIHAMLQVRIRFCVYLRRSCTHSGCPTPLHSWLVACCTRRRILVSQNCLPSISFQMGIGAIQYSNSCLMLLVEVGS